MLTPEEYRTVADQIQGAGEPGYRGVLTVLEAELEEATEFSTNPDTPEDKRTIWAGWQRGLRDLKRILGDLHSGEYKNWPEMKGDQIEAEAGAADGPEED